MTHENKLAFGLHDDLVDGESDAAIDASREVARAVTRALEPGELARAMPLYAARKIQAHMEDLSPTARDAFAMSLMSALEGLIERPLTLANNAPPERFLQVVQPIDARSTPLLPFASANENALVVNDRKQPNLSAMLGSEVPTATQIDLVCAFIKWHGLRLLLPKLKDFIARGGSLRVLTTTYMGVTEVRALDALESIGASVRVCYETHATRLHAKAWLFHRPNTTSTAYIGSSNLSTSALTDGMEWNVRLAARRAPEVVNRFIKVFQAYWSDDFFQPFEREQFERAIALEKQDAPGKRAALLRPYPYQQEILDKLDVERTRHARTENLVVAATGTGKTVIAAFDYRRLIRKEGDKKLLFIAHRADILKQAQRTFAAVLGLEGFGELLVGGARPTAWEHVFASIQSLKPDTIEQLDRNHFDIIIVDECHHITADTYERALDYFEPDILLGLTATPERMDNAPVLARFDDTFAAEIRLWDAIAQQLLVPFQYFGIHDGTDLSQLSFTGGRYAVSELDNVYTSDDARARLIHAQIEAIVTDPRSMRAIGFCVSIAHAEFMAATFAEYGYATLALTSKSDRATRDSAPEMLASGALQIIFTVDLYNEGVDIPSVDTLLMLRPTESATVFLQQLGRGLRHAPGKPCLTVLDFIGHAHKKFNFAKKYTALLGTSSTDELEKGIREENLYLPAGCAFVLDEISQREVLDHIKATLDLTLAATAKLLSSYQNEPTLLEFTREQDLAITDLYKTKTWCWTGLLERANLATPSPYERAFVDSIKERIFRLTHIDDQVRLAFYRHILDATTAPDPARMSDAERRLITMLHNLIWSDLAPPMPWSPTLPQALDKLRESSSIRRELLELFEALEDHAALITTPLSELVDGYDQVPLSVHATYTRAEILSAFGALGVGEKSTSREGVYYETETGTDIFFVTLDKSSDAYSAEVMYRDYPIDRDLFHWESQNSTSEETPVGARYIDPNRDGMAMLFVRERDKIKGNTLPYHFLGPISYVSHVGEKPMAITWKLAKPIPRPILAMARRATA